MLIDINAYVGHWPFMQLKYNTVDALHERMNKFGVDISVISNLNGIFYKNTQSANEELFEEIKSKAKFRDRFIPFAVINPIYAGWRDDLDVCINKFGFKGVRIYPNYHDFEILDPACIELVKRVRDYGLPVAFNYRMVDSRQRSWIDTAYVKDNLIKEWNLKNILPMIKAVPDAKYMILNFANAATLNAEEKALIKKTNLIIRHFGQNHNQYV
jgi:predicted TIM-barrel fold metal-dependent hydrolase